VDPRSNDHVSEDPDYEAFCKAAKADKTRSRQSSISSESTATIPPAKRQKPNIQPTQGDTVLLSFLDPDQHHVAIHAGKHALVGDSDSEGSDEMEEVCGPEADTGIAISKGRHKPSPDISMTAAEGKEKGIEGTSGGEDQGDGSANGSSAGQAEQAPTTEMMQLDVKGDVGNGSIGGDKVSDQGDLRQVEMSDTPVDPALQNQGVPELLKENGVAEPTTDSTLDISSAASLISLAGGAFQYLSAQNASAQHVGTNGTAWPSSPESPNKTFNGHSQLPSMMGQNSSPASRDGKHTTLPSLGSIEVLADLATKQGDSPQQGWKGPRAAYPQVQANLHISPSNRPPTTVQSPGLPLPPTPASSEGTPRPPIQYQTVEQRRTFIPNEQQHAPFGYYAPIKDTSASPQPPYTTPDSANLFAVRGGFSPATTDGRRPSTSSEFQYNSDHTATTPRGPSTCDTMASSSTEDGLVAQPPPPAPAPRSRGHSSALPPGGFKCEFEGCKAPPFQTQYLLKYVTFLVLRCESDN
jgi:hypothetical protein